MAWIEELKRLSSIVVSHSPATFAAFTHALISRWTYLARTTPNIEKHQKPLEETIRKVFLPNLTGQNTFNDMALSTRYGGLGIINPCEKSTIHYSASESISAPFVTQVLNQSDTYSFAVKEDQTRRKGNACKFYRQLDARTASDLKENLPIKLPSPSVLRKAPRTVYQPYPSPNMVLLYTKEIICVYGMVGAHHTLLLCLWPMFHC